MAGLRIEMWPVDRLVPYVGNPRKNDQAVDRMVAVIREFGFRVPLVARSDGELVDGHLRLKAAFSMGIREVPVLLADDMTPEQVRAFRLMIMLHDGIGSAFCAGDYYAVAKFYRQAGCPRIGRPAL